MGGILKRKRELEDEFRDLRKKSSKVQRHEGGQWPGGGGIGQ